MRYRGRVVMPAEPKHGGSATLCGGQSMSQFHAMDVYQWILEFSHGDESRHACRIDVRNRRACVEKSRIHPVIGRNLLGIRVFVQNVRAYPAADNDQPRKTWASR